MTRPRHPNATRPDEFQVATLTYVNGTVDATNLPSLADAWLRTTGPTSTLLWYYVARAATAPDPQPVTIAELSAWSGVAAGGVWSALDRLVMFRRCTWLAGDVLGVEVITDVAPCRAAR